MMPAPNRRYLFCNEVLDLGSRSVSRAGVGVPLRRKVFDLLSYLFIHRDRAVGKEELFREIWAGTNVSDDVLVGAIRAIRLALCGDSRSQAVIRTIHGYGYQFVAPAEPHVEAHSSPEPSPRRGKRVWIGTAGALLVVLAVAGTHSAREPSRPASAPAMPAESAWLRFDEPAGDRVMDSSGKQNHGRILNRVVRMPGVLGSALEFDGLGGQLVGDSPGNGFPFGDSPRTVTCRVRTSDRRRADVNILHWGTPSGTPPRLNFHLFLSAGHLGWGNGYGQGCLKTDRDVSDGKWHHVAGVYSGAPLHASYVYLDAKPVAESDGPIPADTRAGAAWTTGVFMGGGVPFAGALDDLRVFNAALSDSMIKALYYCAYPEAAFQAPMPGKPYFLPVGGAELEVGKEDGPASTVVLENRKETFAAAQFATSDGLCACNKLRGSSLPVRVRISMVVEFPAARKDYHASIGPFLNSRPLAPVDRPLAPVDSPAAAASAGYWAALDSAGCVTLRPLAQHERILASSRPIAGFDLGKPHTIVVEAVAEKIRVSLDNIKVLESSIPQPMSNGAAGVAFEVQGRPLYNLPQRVRNVIVEAL